MARSRNMQEALDIVAGRKPAAPTKSKWNGLERLGLVLWVGVGIMIVGLAVLFLLG
jgi:hypothetical protein